MKPRNILLGAILLLLSFTGSAQSLSTITPDNAEQGSFNIPITIIGTGTSFIPGFTTCAELSGGLSLNFNGTASSAVEFTGFLTIPIFTPTGSYDLTVYQGPGCGSATSWSCTDCFTICQPFNILGIPADASCFGCTDGSISQSVFGGQPPYNFNWSTGETTEDIGGLAAGTYTVTISDATGCDAVRNYDINQPEAISVSPSSAEQGEVFTLAVTANASLFSTVSTTCVDITNGSDTYNATGAASSSSDFTASVSLPPGATPGFYDVIVFEGPGCIGEQWSCSNCFFICDQLSITGVVQDASCAICSDGMVDISIIGGTLPFSYNWSNGSTLQDATGLEEGTYSVTVTDVGGCQGTASFTVTEPDPIMVNPSNANPGTTVSVVITGVGTTFIAGTTTCAEIQMGSETYTISGSASNEILFNGSMILPLSATPGSYNATIYENGCSGTSWSCNDCFTINDYLNCGVTVYDNGGQFGDYLNNTNETWTICPENIGETVSVLFTQFDMENDGDNCLDELTIYDGNNAAAPIIPSPSGTTTGWCWDQSDVSMNGSGNLEGMTISSTDPSGCLTFNFASNDMGTRAGWAFEIQCNQEIAFGPSSGTRGSNFPLTITGFGTNFSPSTTTCAEISLGGEIYQITGTASSPTSFSGNISIPLGASQGLYNGTVYEGPGCTGGSLQLAVWNCVNCFQVLPPLLSVEWLSFEATARATDILLDWSTATEINSDFYGVERSPDGISWEEIGRTNSAGNTTATTEYSFIDIDPLKANNYYRIRQVDMNGDYSYSDVEVVKFGQEATAMEIFPNPAIHEASLVVSSLWAEDIKINLTGISGKTLQTWDKSVTNGTQVFELNLFGLPNGVYFISVEGEQNWQPIRFTKIR